MQSTTTRLKALQSVVNASKIDALLIVGGIDGRNHDGSREVLNWLLNGSNGRDIFGYSRIDQGGLDEVVLLISADAVRLYATRPLWSKMQPCLARWRRLQVWLPPAEMDDDIEAQEEHKIRSFIAMLRGIKSIGVPLPAADAGSGPAAAVEAWPLVQAYALQDFEELTGGGFFTQQHAVAGMGEAVRAVLLQLDVPNLEWLSFVEGPRLASCLSECLGSFDAVCEAGRPLRASEVELCEPALAYHAHGQLRATNLPVASALLASPPDLPAFTSKGAPSSGVASSGPGGQLRPVGLLIGHHTSALLHAAKTANAGAKPSAARPGEPDGYEAAPRHMCLELAEPIGPLYAGRTYFLGSGARAPPRDISQAEEGLLDTDETAGPIKPKSRGARGAIAAAAAAAETSSYEDARSGDSDLMQGMYGCLVASVDSALGDGEKSVQALCAEATGADKLAAVLAEEIARRAVVAQLLPALSAADTAAACAARIVVQASCADTLGNGYHSADAAAMAAKSGLVLTLRVVLSLDGLLEGESELRGSLLLGETYVRSPHGGLVSLSACVPRYEVWRAAGPETEASADLSSACDTAMRITFGRVDAGPLAGSLRPTMPSHALVGGLLGMPSADIVDGCVLLPCSASLQPLVCTLYPFARGAVLLHPRAGSMLLLFDAGLSPRRVDVYEHEGTTTTATQPEGASHLLIRPPCSPARLAHPPHLARVALGCPFLLRN